MQKTRSLLAIQSNIAYAEQSTMHLHGACMEKFRTNSQGQAAEHDFEGFTTGEQHSKSVEGNWIPTVKNSPQESWLVRSLKVCVTFRIICPTSTSPGENMDSNWRPGRHWVSECETSGPWNKVDRPYLTGNSFSVSTKPRFVFLKRFFAGELGVFCFEPL